MITFDSWITLNNTLTNCFFSRTFPINGLLIIIRISIRLPQKPGSSEGKYGGCSQPREPVGHTLLSTYLDDINWILCVRRSDRFFTVETQSEKVDCSSYPGKTLAEQAIAQYCQKCTCGNSVVSVPVGCGRPELHQQELWTILRSFFCLYESNQNVRSHEPSCGLSQTWLEFTSIPLRGMSELPLRVGEERRWLTMTNHLAYLICLISVKLNSVNVIYTLASIDIL